MYVLTMPFVLSFKTENEMSHNMGTFILHNLPYASLFGGGGGKPQTVVKSTLTTPNFVKGNLKTLESFKSSCGVLLTGTLRLSARKCVRVVI